MTVHDRWAADNHNSVVLARSGAGKSYLIKLEILRSLYDGIQVAVIDPEDEYRRLAAAVGGTIITLDTPGVRLNPLDIPLDDTRPDALTRRALFLHTLIGVLLAGGQSDTNVLSAMLWRVLNLSGGRRPASRFGPPAQPRTSEAWPDAWRQHAAVEDDRATSC